MSLRSALLAWLVPLLAVYAVAAFPGGIGGVLGLMGIGMAGTAVMLGADALAEARRRRRERAAVYRRWASWSFEDWLRRHTSWRHR